MRRRWVLVAFTVLAAAACKNKEPPPPAPGSPSSSTSVSARPAGWVAPPVSAATSASPPPADEWETVALRPAKLAVRLPPGARIPDDQAGHDPDFAGSHFRVTMPSGYDVYFAEKHGDQAIDIAAEKRRYQRGDGGVALVYASDDAVVVNRSGGPPAGTYCEVTACGKGSGRPVCATHAGAIIDGQQVRKLTADECLAVVAIARSIRAL